MKKKISLTLFAAMLAFGAAFASKMDFADGWYVPDSSGSGPFASKPAQCIGGTVLCATRYVNNEAQETANKAH